MENQIIYLSRPFEYTLDDNANVLMSALTDIQLTTGTAFSFCGGFTRDYGVRPYNDFDIATLDPYLYRSNLEELGLLIPGEPDGTDHIPHDYFINPFDFHEQRIPIHFIQTGNQNGFAPTTFDVSINEFSLCSDMRVYAPTYAWREKQKKILRFKDELRMTTNAIMRLVRFSAKLQYEMTEPTLKRIQDFIENETIGSNRVLTGIDKMIEDNVTKESFEILKSIKFPDIEQFSSLEDFRKFHNNKILNGTAHIDNFTHIY